MNLPSLVIFSARRRDSRLAPKLSTYVRTYIDDGRLTDPSHPFYGSPEKLFHWRARLRRWIRKGLFCVHEVPFGLFLHVFPVPDLYWLLPRRTGAPSKGR